MDKLGELLEHIRITTGWTFDRSDRVMLAAIQYAEQQQTRELKEMKADIASLTAAVDANTVAVQALQSGGVAPTGDTQDTIDGVAAQTARLVTNNAALGTLAAAPASTAAPAPPTTAAPATTTNVQKVR